MLVENLKLFLLIVKKGGLGAAGREFGLSPARVSERLFELEAYYDTRLLNRTTRSISLTDEGHELVKSANHILSEIEQLESRIKYGKQTISGTINITVANDFGKNKIAPLLDTFMQEHKEISINLTLNDGYVDLVHDGIDLAFRVGELSDTSLKFTTLAINKRIICASPDYLTRHGIPTHPSELANHNCLLIKFGNMIDRNWKFMVDGRERTFSVSGNRIVNNGELVADWCRAGHGIAFKSLWDVEEDIITGRLVHILQEFQMPQRPLQLVTPVGTKNSLRIKLLIEHLSEGLKDYVLSPG